VEYATESGDIPPKKSRPKKATTMQKSATETHDMAGSTIMATKWRCVKLIFGKGRLNGSFCDTALPEGEELNYEQLMIAPTSVNYQRRCGPKGLCGKTMFRRPSARQ